MIGEAIYYVLQTTSAITNVVDDRVYPVVVPQKVEFPAIVYTKASSDAENTKDEVSTIENATVQIKVMHPSMVKVKDLGAAVRKAFDNLSGTINGIEIDTTKYQGATVIYDEDAQVFMNIITFNFFYKY